jgi:hypothetical protein
MTLTATFTVSRITYSTCSQTSQCKQTRETLATGDAFHRAGKNCTLQHSTRLLSSRRYLPRLVRSNVGTGWSCMIKQSSMHTFPSRNRQNLGHDRQNEQLPTTLSIAIEAHVLLLCTIILPGPIPGSDLDFAFGASIQQQQFTLR